MAFACRSAFRAPDNNGKTKILTGERNSPLQNVTAANHARNNSAGIPIADFHKGRLSLAEPPLFQNSPLGCFEIHPLAERTPSWDSVPHPARGAASGLCQRDTAPLESRCSRGRKCSVTLSPRLVPSSRPRGMQLRIEKAPLVGSFYYFGYCAEDTAVLYELYRETARADSALNGGTGVCL